MPSYQTPFWRFSIFRYISAGAILFVVLTTTAMFFYTGGTFYDHNTTGYSFFINFFSDLGTTHSWSGDTNYISASLFFIAMILAGLSVLLFSLAFPQYFSRTDGGYVSAKCGMYLGTITGIYFMGVALVPGNISPQLHAHFGDWSFRFFSLAALFWTIAIFRNNKYSNKYAWIFIVFFLLLISFVLLVIFGPKFGESNFGNTILATAQKIIVYASVISILLQSLCALAINRKH